MERNMRDVCEDLRGESKQRPRIRGEVGKDDNACVCDQAANKERGHGENSGRGADTTKRGNGYIPDEVELDDGLPRGPLLVEVLRRERELEVCGA